MRDISNHDALLDDPLLRGRIDLPDELGSGDNFDGFEEEMHDDDGEWEDD